MLNAAIFASGNGSNFEALVNSNRVNIVLLVCNNENAYVIERAKKHDIEVMMLNYKDVSPLYNETLAYEVMKRKKVELILLAGFMKKLTPFLIGKYPKCILNIHPSLLPKYKGLNAVDQALEAGETEIGVTVHYVNKYLDDGKVIVQDSIDIKGLDVKDVYEKVHKKEHELYVEALDIVLEEFYE